MLSIGAHNPRAELLMEEPKEKLPEKEPPEKELPEKEYNSAEPEKEVGMDSHDE